MNKTKRPFRFRIGMRNIKTAIAATLCAIGYLTANVIFDTSFDPTFACIGAIFGTGSDMGDSWLNDGNRLFGTIIGGVIGMLMFRLYLFWQPGGEWSFKILPFMFVGVVALIIACQFFRWPGGIQPGGVVLSIILFAQNNPDTYISYSVERIINTAIGVIVALLINHFFPRERLLGIMYTLHLRKRPEAEEEKLEELKELEEPEAAER